MRRSLVVLSISLIIMTIFGCSSNNEDTEEKAIFNDNITVTWDDKESGIESYEANVNVYYKDNRKDSDFSLQQKYHFSTKMIDNEKYVRLDTIPLNDNEQAFISVANERELAVIDPITNNILYRIPMIESNNNVDYRIFSEGIGFSTINLDKVRSECKRLAFDISEDNNESKLEISLPSNLFNSNNSKRISSKIVYDTTYELMIGTESVERTDDDSIVTTKVDYLYDNVDGIYVNIGKVTTVERKYNKKIEGKINKKIYNSSDEVPTITNNEFKELNKKGQLSKREYMRFGDPLDLSYTHTTLELYDDIKINKTDNKAFKSLLK